LTFKKYILFDNFNTIQHIKMSESDYTEIQSLYSDEFAQIFFDHYHQQYIDMIDELMYKNIIVDRRFMIDVIDIIMNSAIIIKTNLESDNSYDSDVDE
jgi:hypothetical protein